MNSIVLRDARPTHEEGLVCAGYLDQAAQGFNRFWMGRRMAHIVATPFPFTNHSYSYENITFAERNEQIVGMALAFTSEQHRQFSKKPLKKAAGFRIEDLRFQDTEKSTIY
tara:strand:- start:6 stop:338 length:333 start_codon:yes stop_codon:yes gene_type:complete